MYTVEDHEISCNFTDIPAQLDVVIWTPETTKSDGYTVKDGLFNPETKSQVSTLTISSDKLVEMKDFAASFIFTCKTTVGFRKAAVSDIQAITIFSPSKSAVFGCVSHKFYLFSCISL